MRKTWYVRMKSATYVSPHDVPEDDRSKWQISTQLSEVISENL